MQNILGAGVPVLSVSELNQRLRRTLEFHFEEVWVGGEISNFRQPASGHFYFTLKDERSQVSAVMFRSANQILPFRPADGLQVIVHGRVSVYEQRGSLQLYVDAMEPRGLGSLQLALQQLKDRLAVEGLFDVARKRPLPFWPRAVGVVTALTGAAIHDIVTTLRGRMPHVRIIVRPVRVQGREAGAEVVAALRDLNALSEVDVVIVGRGGGSLEDLWAFNEEQVVRAIAASRAPVVSAVGHEIDVTLADLAADRRAPTPTGAAALVVPDCSELVRTVAGIRERVLQAMWVRLQQERAQVAALWRRLRNPRDTLRTQRIRIDELAERSRRALLGALRLAHQRLDGNAERLNALSPLAVLNRGYSIVRKAGDGQIVRQARDLSENELLDVTLASGGASVRVESTHD
jgi:exodeoxyribonuclease VII large subunit